MKISRRMQRQVEVIIRHAQAQEVRAPENALATPGREAAPSPAEGSAEGHYGKAP